MANDKHYMHSKSKRTKKPALHPINHWHSTFVVIAAAIIIMSGAGLYANTGAGVLAAYGTSNWIRYGI
jgi:hypothetical protein